MSKIHYHYIYMGHCRKKGEMLLTPIKYLFVMALSILFLSIPIEAKWSTTTFKVQQKAPNNWFEDSSVKIDDIRIKKVEYIFHKAALIYQKMGFKEPKLPKEDNAFIVNIYNYPDHIIFAQYKNIFRSEYFGVFGTSYEGNMLIDSSRLLDKNGHIETLMYHTFIHELFHAIQFQYKVNQTNPNIRNWISEGTANAVANYIIDKLKYPHRDKYTQFGLRHYFIPLNITDTNETNRQHSYYTSSFWEYLAKYKSTNNAIDYSYLVKLYEKEISGKYSEKNELQWVDTHLKNEFGIGLERMYTKFISTILKNLPKEFHKKNTKKLHKILFEKCPTLSFNMNQSEQKMITFNLEKLSSRCFQLDLNLPNTTQADISIEVANVDLDSLKSLTISTEDGLKLAKGTVIKQNDAGKYFASWLFSVPVRANNNAKLPLFVISNFSSTPSKTKKQTPTLMLYLSSFQSNITTAKKISKSKSKNKLSNVSTAKPIPSGIEKAKNIAESLHLGMKSLDAYQSIATTVGRKNTEKEACKGHFKTKLCGPSTNIHLSLATGNFGSLEHVGASTENRFLGMIMGMSQLDTKEVEKDWMNAAKAAKKMEGSSISISFPLIDYGFKGSFSNAIISVNLVDGSDSTYTPSDRNGRPGYMDGQVNIEEYTPHVLRGSFSGILHTTGKNIDGRFNIIRPWAKDKRFNAKAPDIDSMVTDIGEMFGININAYLSSNPELKKKIEEAKAEQNTKKSKTGSSIQKPSWFKATISGDLNASFSKNNRYIKLGCKTKGSEKILLLDTGKGVTHQFKLGIPYASLKVGKLPLVDLTSRGNIPASTASIAYVYLGLLKHSPLQSLTRKYSKNLKGYINITNVPKKPGEYFKGEIIAEASIKNLPEKTVKVNVSFSLPMKDTQLKSCIP